MRTRPTLLSAVAFGACVSALAGACQVYDFERVEPLAISQTTVEEDVNVRNSKPNVMLLVDTSGSMTEPVDPSDPDCKLPDGDICFDDFPCNPAVCPTRWTELQAAAPKFLADTGSLVRFGLVTYPDTRSETGLEAFCRSASAASTSMQKDLPSADDDATLLAHANSINDILQKIPNAGAGRPRGGTPTSLSLRFVKDLPGLQDTQREQFVVLLTDGLPNCNAENVYEDDDPQCRCTQPSGCAQVGKSGCLDMDASVTAVRELAAKHITTIVIGFGSETATGNGPAVLDAMARAGGFARTCEAGETSCGPGDPCDPVTHLCQRTFYQAGNQAELAQALEDISNAVRREDPCLIKLDPSQLPSDPKLVAVYVEGERIVSGDGTWVLTDKGVLFNGAMCERILATTPESRLNIKVRAIRQR
ncbi:adventurous gliding motility lipoprotein CglB [Pyxidicoccus parkwayensis]|uniref:Adventurous gliding motility lipoprotein CglB n=1 Tax=Pyxidicoccus parkwayensis TaxID=2813578 RepID=A0ABX7NST5_9BACT|nr:adventurous gliding motility lipoprotein CglB [Pyxidicoccus parkwaysis]QSQ20461.1 adventurous gliding motility lipoprotein CglB [Pyxidicoccus parkwaysis]